MMIFVEKLEPYILNDDKFISEFALKTINTSHLGTEHTFMLALKALDKLPIHPMKNKIIPFTRNLPITENVLLEVLNRLKKQDGNAIWYNQIIERCDTTLLHKYKDRLPHFANKQTLKKFESLLEMDVEQLFEEAARIMLDLEENGYKYATFQYGKRVFKELIRRGEYDSANFWEIEVGVKQYAEEEFYPYDGIYNVYLAGEQKVYSLIPNLIKLLIREEEDILLEEIATALIKMGNDEVIETIEGYLQDTATSFSAVEVLENIKRPSAENALLRQLDLVTDVTTKTIIADGLCKQLSTKAIPKVAALLEEGFDASMLDLEEPLYVNCIINQVDHPYLAQWKQHLINQETYWAQQEKWRTQEHAKQQKIGRNDPCICGSGKKFKKCCGR